jgi:hypothetical protein
MAANADRGGWNLSVVLAFEAGDRERHPWLILWTQAENRRPRLEGAGHRASSAGVKQSGGGHATVHADRAR